MMRLWVESYSKSAPVSSSAMISVVTHALVIGAAIVSTNRPANIEADWIENRAYYLPPPNRVPAQEGARETIRYVELAPEGVGAGFGKIGVGAERPEIKETSESTGDLGRDLTSTEAAPKLAGEDSVFSQLEVDSIVARYPGSASPAYPVEMLKQGMQGSVTTQYVVDTTGFADTTSLKIMRTTHPEFADDLHLNVLIPSLTLGGAERMVVETVLGLAERRPKVKLFVLNEAETSARLDDKAAVVAM